ncbi:MAG: hypothetical protein ACE5Q6_21305 [Dehalococcoidia bacterium]
MPVQLSELPCSHCPYVAVSDQDLAGHMAHAHPSASSGQVPDEPEMDAGPAVVPAPVPATLPSAPIPAPVATLPPGLQIPETDPTFWVDDKVARLLFMVGNLSRRGEILNLLLTGPKGTGKTSLTCRSTRPVLHPPPCPVWTQYRRRRRSTSGHRTKWWQVSWRI